MRDIVQQWTVEVIPKGDIELPDHRIRPRRRVGPTIERSKAFFGNCVSIYLQSVEERITSFDYGLTCINGREW